MIFFAVLLLATLLAAIALRNTADWRRVARWGLGTALVVAGATHLLNPTPFEQHLPSWVPAATLLVVVSGLVEITLGGALVATTGRTPIVGLVTASYLIAVFPANVHVAVAGVEVDGQPGGIYPWIRLPFQVLFIAWALWSTQPEGQSRLPKAVSARVHSGSD